ncbi:hypothetical protein KSP39_PZI022224 [Platanthera zijinensis]|uniref:Uncharacterized protein n=1 Tax=Platanthera zijinensis TaxID=2320716 RepID=A0AAP0FV90_9ASPA
MLTMAKQESRVDVHREPSPELAYAVTQKEPRKSTRTKPNRPLGTEGALGMNTEEQAHQPIWSTNSGLKSSFFSKISKKKFFNDLRWCEAAGPPLLPPSGSVRLRRVFLRCDSVEEGCKPFGVTPVDPWRDCYPQLESAYRPGKGIVEPSMEQQPRRSARLEMGQSSSGVHTAGTVSLDLE